MTINNTTVLDEEWFAELKQRLFDECDSREYAEFLYDRIRAACIEYSTLRMKVFVAQNSGFEQHGGWDEMEDSHDRTR